jgi:hypothetical protein
VGQPTGPKLKNDDHAVITITAHSCDSFTAAG